MMMTMMKMTVMLTLSTGYGDCFHCSSSSIVPSVGADDDANDDFLTRRKHIPVSFLLPAHGPWFQALCIIHC